MLDFDLMLLHVGEFGLYQKILFIFQAPFCIFVTFVLFGQLFLTLYPNVYWCQDHFQCIIGNMTPALRGNLSTPFVGGSFDPCNFRELDFEYLEALQRSTETRCHGPTKNGTTPPCFYNASVPDIESRLKRYSRFRQTEYANQYTDPKFRATTVRTTTKETPTTIPPTAAPLPTTQKIIESTLATTLTGGAMKSANTCGMKGKCSRKIEFRQNLTIFAETIRRSRTCGVTQCKEIGWDNSTIGVPYRTIVTEGGWWCQADLYVTASQSIFFVGAIVGGFIIGYIADTVGRVPALVIANLLGAIGGALSVVSTNFWLFMLFRFITGMAFDNCFTMMYILVLEFSGPRYRTLVANLSIAVFYTLGTLLIPWLAVWISDWQIYGLVISLPMFLGLLALFIVPESARWLLSKGRAAEATEILRSFAKVNRKQVDEAIFVEFEQSARELYEQLSTEEEEASLLDVFKTPRLRRTFILLVIIWSLIALVYDGHSRNIMNLANEDWSVFAMFTIASMTEFPADMFLIFTLDVLGRRWLSFGSLALSGTFALIAATVPPTVSRSAFLVFAILSRFCVNLGFNIGLQYAAELLPTVIRAQGVNAIHTMGYVASVISPFVAMVGRRDLPLSLILLGVCSAVAAALSLLLPETLGEDLPNSLEEAENFGKDQSFWNCPACGTGGGRMDESEKMMPTPAPVQLRNSIMSTSRRGETYRSSIISMSSSHSSRSTIRNIPLSNLPNESTKLTRRNLAK